MLKGRDIKKQFVLDNIQASKISILEFDDNGFTEDEISFWHSAIQLRPPVLESAVAGASSASAVGNMPSSQPQGQLLHQFGSAVASSAVQAPVNLMDEEKVTAKKYNKGP